MRVFESQTSGIRQALCAALLCVCAGTTGLAAKEGFKQPSFGHYQPILDRMPFGTIPPAVAAAVDPALAQTAAQTQAEQQKLAKQVSMSAVTVTPDGQTAIGFTDLSVNPPINHYVLVGETADGWSVVSADYDTETATIQKNDVSITLQLGKGLIDPASQPAKPASQRPAGLPPNGMHSSPSLGRAPGTSLPFALHRAAPSPNAPSDKPPEAAAGEAAGSYRERLLERKQLESKELRAAAKRQQEQLVKLAHEAAANEIKRREEEAAQAAANAPQPEESPQVAPPQEAQ